MWIVVDVWGSVGCGDVIWVAVDVLWATPREDFRALDSQVITRC